MRANSPLAPQGSRPPRRIETEPKWQSLSRYTNDVLPTASRLWLADDGSLTARLIALGRGPFRVHRLFQGWEVPLPSERLLLGIANREVALVREVALALGDDVVVFARSVFPHQSLSGHLAHLRRLQNKSLGAILFKHPRMHRCPFQLALIPGDSTYLPPQLHQAKPAWGRRSRFDIDGKPIMVSEVFLESFEPWPALMAVHRSQRGKVSTAIEPATQ